MSENKLEDLSAFADGELSASETQFFARRLAHDAELRGHWSRLQLVRSCMHGTGATAGKPDLCDQISARIEAEPALSISESRSAPTWLRPVAGMAVAAAVAVASLVVLREPGVPEGAGAPTAQTLVSGANASEEVLLVPTDLNPPVSTVSWANQRTTRDQRLRAYLMRHNDEAAKNRRLGLGNNIYLISRPQQVQSAAADVDTASTDVAEGQ